LANVTFLTFHRFIIDDRKIYKPKEEVHLKGFLRLFAVDEVYFSSVLNNQKLKTLSIQKKGWKILQLFTEESNMRIKYDINDDYQNKILEGEIDFKP
jgi:hypothetical protein